MACSAGSTPDGASSRALPSRRSPRVAPAAMSSGSIPSTTWSSSYAGSTSHIPTASSRESSRPRAEDIARRSASADSGGSCAGRRARARAGAFARRDTLMAPMSQMPLFADASDTVLVDDELGRIVYMPGVVPAEIARAWLAALREGVPWKAQRRRMSDRDVDVPRPVAHFPLAPEEGGVPDAIRAVARKVMAITGAPYTSVGLNLYRDGRDSVAAHNDDLDEIVDGSPIALLSLGAIRRMTIRTKKLPRRVMHIDLAAG